MAVRMKDIAQALNVSIVTVSKVLNNDLTISEATRFRVLETARRLGYRTNLTAKSLVTGRSMMLGLIVPELFHGFFAEIAAHMSDVLRENDYGLLIASSREDSELERNEIEQMLARNVDALVIATCKGQSDPLKAAAREAPLVLLDRQLKTAIGASYVGTNNVMAGELAAQHLIDLGRLRFAYIGGPNSSPSNDREAGFLNVLSAHQIGFPDSYLVKRIKNDELSPVTGAEAMRKLLKLKPLPDAVFCYNDPTAIGAISAILEAKLRIPEDIAVVGCGNIQHAAYMRVPLTSVDQNVTLLGQSAANLALAAIGNSPDQQGKFRKIIVPPTLIIRNSTGSAVSQLRSRSSRNK